MYYRSVSVRVPRGLLINRAVMTEHTDTLAREACAKKNSHMVDVIDRSAAVRGTARAR